MKKLLLVTALVLGFVSNAFAERPQISMGVSGTFGLLDATGHETLGSTLVASKRTEKEMPIAFASIFAEVGFMDRLRIGVEYVPHSLESETSQNVRAKSTTSADADLGAVKTNNIQIDVKDLSTLYASLYIKNGFFITGGVMEGDLITNELLETGSQYGNSTLKGTTIGIGFERELDNGVFIRSQVNQMEFDNLSLRSSVANSSGGFNLIEVKDLSGVSARLSVGKTF